MVYQVPCKICSPHHSFPSSTHGILSKSRADFPSQNLASPMTPFSRYTQNPSVFSLYCRSPSPRWFSGVAQRRIARFLRGPSEKPSNPYAGPFAVLHAKVFFFLSFSSLICYSIAVEPCNSLFLIDVPTRHPFTGAVAPLWDLLTCSGSRAFSVPRGLTEYSWYTSYLL